MFNLIDPLDLIISLAAPESIIFPGVVILPEAVILPTISKLLLKSQVLLASSQSKLAFEPSTIIPEPFELASICPLPKVISLSTTSKLFTL